MGVKNLKLFCFVVSLFLTASAWADGPLRAVVVFGNQKTDRNTILRLLNLPDRAYVDANLMQEADDRLINSGLFKEVKVSKIDNRDGTVDLRILVAEKQLWFAFPIAQAWSGRYSAGGAFGESNVFFPNTRTLFLGELGNKNGRFFSVLDSKNLWQSNFAFRTWVLVRSDDVPLYNGTTLTDQTRILDYAVSLRPGYQWTNEIQTSMEFKYRYLDFDSNAAVAAERALGNNDISLRFDFHYDSLRRRDGFLKGNSISMGYEFGERRFGTDFSYHIEELSWSQARVFYNFLNWIFYFKGAIGDRDLPFHRDFTQGGSSLRGYQDRQFRGDTELVFKQDVLFPLWRHKRFSLFGDVFFDSGLLYYESSGLDRDSFHNGTGAGVRVSLADILAPVFGLDVAYAIEDKSYQILFALGLVQF